MNKDDATMKNPEIYSKLMECNKEFLVNYLLYLDEWLTKYGSALDKACHVIEELNDCTNIGTDAYHKCPFMEECNKDRFNGCISNNEKWKEWLLNND